LFAKFGPKAKREEAKSRRRLMAALYGDKGKPPKQQFAREAAEFNRRAKQRFASEAKELNRRVMSPELKKKVIDRSCAPLLFGGGATRTKSMLQYVNRMLRDKECQKIVEDAYANGLFGKGRAGGKRV
jgi:hypothetical protein